MTLSIPSHNEFVPDLIHPKDADKRIVDMTQKIEVLRYARGYGDKNVDRNPIFKHLPYNMTRANLVELIGSYVPRMQRDDQQQAAMTVRWPHGSFTRLSNDPVALAAEVRSHLSHWRLAILDWHVSWRIQHCQTPALDYCICLIDKDLNKLVHEYARQCVNPTGLPRRNILRTHLTTEQIDMLDILATRKVMGMYVSVREVVGDTKDKNVLTAARNYLYNKVRLIKTAARKKELAKAERRAA